MIYLGKFLHTTSQQAKKESERRHGEFNLIVTARDKKGALRELVQRLVPEGKIEFEYYGQEDLERLFEAWGVL